nr:hypothetical protein CFP56_55461 [Quercus suber]
MSKEKEKVGSNQFRWLPPMHTTMFTLLAEEAMKGNKPLNTFMAGSFAIVAQAIFAKFRVECYPLFVENRLRTLRTMWSTIQTLQKKSGFGWDDNLKMITCDAKTYQEEVMQENGDDTEIVADNGEEGMVDKGEKGKNAVKSSTTGSTVSKSRKRGRAPPNDDSVLTDLSDQLKEIVVALKEINRGPVDYTSLYSEVMAMASDGYSEDMLATTFNHLCENKKASKGFLAKNTKLRKLWMDSFFFFTRL